MAGHVVLFEDEGYRNFYPLTLNNPVYSLRCGIRMLGEKIQAAYPRATFVYHVRKLLEPFLKEYLGYRKINCPVNECKAENALLVNGRALWYEEFGQNIRIEGPDKIFVRDDTVIAARLSGANLAAVDWSQPITLNRLPQVEKIEVDYPVLKYPWNLVQNNSKEILREFKALARPGEIEGTVYEGVHILGREHVYIAAGAKVMPGVVIDAEEGPVFIDKDAKIFPNAVIEGPTYVGKKSAIKIGAKIYEGTSVGPVCKVGGEVEESIIHSYSNKQHDGFLGHAYLGLWVNLGANTNNSDLKNEYGTVKVTINGERIDTGSLFVGCTIGDHSKTGINTMLNTGTVIGIGCNIYGSGLPPTYVPSFCWGGPDGFVEYRADKFIQVAKRVMEYRVDKFIEVARRVVSRRDMEMGPEEEALLRKIHEMTAEERKAVCA